MDLEKGKKSFAIRRISTAYGAVANTRQIIDSWKNGTRNLQSSVKIHTPSRTLPFPVVFNSYEQGPEDIVGNINVLGTIPTKELLCCHYSENYKYIVSGTVDGYVRLFDNETKKMALQFSDEDISKVRTPVTSIKYRPANNGHPQTDSIVCTYVTGYIKCWNYKYKKCIYTIREKRQIFGLAYHIREPKFITFGDDCKLNIYDEETMILERVFGTGESSKDGHTARIFSACFHPHSNHVFLSAGWDETIQFWDTRVPKPFRNISGPNISGDGLDIIPSRNEILTCSWRKKDQIQLWDFDSGKLKTTIEPDSYQSNLYCGKSMQVNNNYFIITGGTDPNTVRLIDTQSNLTVSSIRTLPGGIYNMDIGCARKESRENRNIYLSTATPDSSLPRIIFCSGKKIYEIDFGL